MMGFIQTWRWYGPDDIVTLAHIRQAGASGVVTALHHVPVGDVWPVNEIRDRQTVIEDAGLRWQVVESVNIHESIKLGTSERDLYLKNYQLTLENLAACGLSIICYNFMPVLDWTRTDLSYRTDNGAQALRYDHIALAAFDLFALKRENARQDYSKEIQQLAKTHWYSLDKEQRLTLQQNILAGLPGTQKSLSIEEFKKYISKYQLIDRDTLKFNLKYFLQQVVPTAQQLGVKLAIHPDDPPYSLFGLPRIMSCAEDIEYLATCMPQNANGITFCSGSMAPLETNNLSEIIARFGDRIHFVHLRNIQRQNNGSFFEADHLGGSVDMYAVMKSLLLEMAKRRSAAAEDWRIPMRPDHGHQMLDDLAKKLPYPGYSAIGRLRGLAELRGLELGIQKGLN